jgi:hypothetical protein
MHIGSHCDQLPWRPRAGESELVVEPEILTYLGKNLDAFDVVVEGFFEIMYVDFIVPARLQSAKRSSKVIEK